MSVYFVTVVAFSLRHCD